MADVACPDCNGLGSVDCYECNGDGRCHHCGVEDGCPACLGQRVECGYCFGSGIIDSEDDPTADTHTS